MILHRKRYENVRSQEKCGVLVLETAWMHLPEAAVQRLRDREADVQILWDFKNIAVAVPNDKNIPQNVEDKKYQVLKLEIQRL